MRCKNNFLLPYLAAGIALSLPGLAQAIPAVVVPGSADVSRVKPEERMPAPARSADEKLSLPHETSTTPIPEGAKGIHFVLNSVTVEGATAYTKPQLEKIYAQYIGKEVSLDMLWKIAGDITTRYHDDGYFLSRAYVPQQGIKGGNILIRVVEGRIGKVDMPENLRPRRVVQGYVARLLAQKPISTNGVESFLLQMNDIPGLSFRAVLAPHAEGEPEDTVTLALDPAETKGKGSLTFDNFSSRYLGPNELSGAYSASLLPLQQTSLSVLSSMPMEKLRYGTLTHTIAIAPDLALELNGGMTRAHPGYSLEVYDIDSMSLSQGVALSYQALRQRQQNLSFKLAFDRKDIRSDILGVPLTRDHIRALRLSSSYDMSDNWQGYNSITATLSRGLNFMGSSDKDDRNLSRSHALPDFTKGELSLSRLQGITDNWSALFTASGQLASGVLYSSEQYGYGGQNFGRAYDTSDITGDHGVSGALELRYGGWGDLQPVSLQPYTFYDIGEVWNEGTGSVKRASGASAGLGMRFSTRWNQSGNVGFAWPLTKPIATPIYGQSTEGPRITLQVGQSF